MFFPIIILSIIIGCNQFCKSPIEELKETGEKLKNIENKEYSYQLKSFRSYAGDTLEHKGKIYFENNPKDTVIGLKFYNKTKTINNFYNGNHIISLLKKDSSALKKPLIDYQDGHMTVYPFLELSLGAIQNFLNDTSLAMHIDSLSRKDTIFHNEKCHSYSFWADNLLVDTHKKYEGRKKIKLIIREKDNIPVFYSQYEPLRRKNNQDFNYEEAIFSDFIFTPKKRKDIFSIENIPSYYKWDKFTSINNLIPLKSKAPDWKLPLISGDSIALNSLNGKYVLLDFWFIGCGSCIQSIPVLNELQEEYSEGKLTIIGVNCFSNSEKKIEEYCQSNNMNFKNVWKGEEISNDYKVNAAPIFYLIDKEGKIVYRQIGHDEEKLQTNVEEIIKNGHQSS